MLVTVLMSVYNCEEYLKAAIDSILSQTFTDFEFIILDDGSSDGSVKIVKDYESRDSRIVLIQNDINLGLAASLNKGILAAKGKYIARQDADDLSAPNRLALQVEYAIANPDVDVIGTNCFFVDIYDQIVYEDLSFSADQDLYTKLLNKKAIFAHGSAFIKTDKLKECGMYDERFYFVQDGELWLKMLSKKAKIHILHESLYFYKVTPVPSPKRKKTKEGFNKVLRMMYADFEASPIVDKELETIVESLRSLPKTQHPFYLSIYWKALANASYLNNVAKNKTYKYLGKALSEKNSVKNYIQYLTLSVVYIFPKSVIQPLFKFVK